jgi:hypothetical protein
MSRGYPDIIGLLGSLAQGSRVICLGLGNFATSLSSLYQLALLLEIIQSSGKSAYAWDPVFTETEISFLRKYNIRVKEKYAD